MLAKLPNQMGTFWFRILVALVFLAVAFIAVLPTIADYQSVVAALRPISTLSMVLLVVVGGLNITTPSFVHRSIRPTLRPFEAVSTDWASTAVTNSLPAGGAVALGVSWSMYRSFGLSKSGISQIFLVSGAGDNAVKFAMPAFALAWLAVDQPIDGTLLSGAVLGVLLLVVSLVLGSAVVIVPSSQVISAGLRRLPRHGQTWAANFDTVTSECRALLASRWRPICAFVLVDQAVTAGLFVVALRAVSVDASTTSLAALIVAYSFGRLASALPLTPGGAGIVELGLIGALLQVSTSPTSALVAGVLVFRALSYLLPTVLGFAAWMLWRIRRD